MKDVHFESVFKFPQFTINNGGLSLLFTGRKKLMFGNSEEGPRVDFK